MTHQVTLLIIEKNSIILWIRKRTRYSLLGYLGCKNNIWFHVRINRWKTQKNNLWAPCMLNLALASRVHTYVFTTLRGAVSLVYGGDRYKLDVVLNKIGLWGLMSWKQHGNAVCYVFRNSNCQAKWRCTEFYVIVRCATVVTFGGFLLFIIINGLSCYCSLRDSDVSVSIFA